jgi:hypothetical protein
MRTVKPARVTMMIAVAETIAAHAEPRERVPSPLNQEVHPAVRQAVAEKARAMGLSNTARAEAETNGIESVLV